MCLCVSERERVRVYTRMRAPSTCLLAMNGERTNETTVMGKAGDEGAPSAGWGMEKCPYRVKAPFPRRRDVIRCWYGSWDSLLLDAVALIGGAA